jgi:hypothetical protein
MNLLLRFHMLAKVTARHIIIRASVPETIVVSSARRPFLQTVNLAGHHVEDELTVAYGDNMACRDDAVLHLQG